MQSLSEEISSRHRDLRAATPSGQFFALVLPALSTAFDTVDTAHSNLTVLS